MSTTTPVSPSVVKDITRLLVSYATTALVALVAHFGFHPSLSVLALVTTAVGAGVAVALRLIEVKFAWVGALLGYIGRPSFRVSTRVTNAQVIAELTAQVAALQAQAAELAHPSQPTEAPVSEPPVASNTPAGA